MLFIFALPVMQVILFCLAIGRDPTGLHLAIVNGEMNWTSMSCPVAEGCSYKTLSCRYLKALPNDTIIQVLQHISYLPRVMYLQKILCKSANFIVDY